MLQRNSFDSCEADNTSSAAPANGQENDSAVVEDVVEMSPELIDFQSPKWQFDLAEIWFGVVELRPLPVHRTSLKNCLFARHLNLSANSKLKIKFIITWMG